MPKAKVIEKKIEQIEGFCVDILCNGKNVRDDAVLPKQYDAKKMSKNAMTVSGWKDKFKEQFPDYDAVIYKKDGKKASGQTKLSTVRDTYLED